MTQTSDIEQARHTLQEGSLAFVLVRDGRIIAQGAESGVIELLATVDRLGEAVRGAVLADKVVGKAVALIVVQFGIREVDTGIVSQGAVDFLQGYGIRLRFRTLVPHIRNRRNTGLCPMEQATLPYSDPAEGTAALRGFFTRRDAATKLP